MLILKSGKISGVVFVDTVSLDGETSLKEKYAPKETNRYQIQDLPERHGHIICDVPNANLERWDAKTTIGTGSLKQEISLNIKNLLLRGSTLRNTDFIIGIVVYTGSDTKIQ